jgi:hypothetical protein
MPAMSHRVARQHSRRLPDQPKARAGAFASGIEPFEGGGRDRNLGNPGNVPNCPSAICRSEKSGFRRPDAQDIADVKARSCQLFSDGALGRVGGRRNREQQ